MSTIWEEGGRIIHRTFSEEEMRERSYVFNVVQKDVGPFVNMKAVKRNEIWDVYYQTERLYGFHDYLKRSTERGELKINVCLDLMVLLLEALDAAEERMILSGSFEISDQTVWINPWEHQIQIMYLPEKECHRGRNQGFWTRKTTTSVLQMVLGEVERVDRTFSLRWPFLKETFEMWEKTGFGRKRCIREIRNWISEFPDEK